MNRDVEIASSQKVNKQKGDLLENLASIIFEKKGYKVVKELRRTGVEVDLSAKDIKTNEKVYVECKAHRDNLSAEVIAKIIGNKAIHHYDLAILITTGPLSKDALGIIDKMDEESQGRKKDFCVYNSDEIIELLISNNVIKHNLSLQGLDKIDNIVGYTLLITEISYYWLIKLHPNNINIANVIVLYDAKTGEPINNRELLNKIYETDHSFKDYEWQLQNSVVLNNSKLTNEYDNIIPIAMGDDWFDTRPARPVDFVGHDNEIKKIIKLYNDVIRLKTNTRVYALLSPSGMGKSSLALKIKHESELKFKEKIFNFNVDVRSATSEKYVEAVILKALENMNNNNLVLDVEQNPKKVVHWILFAVQHILAMFVACITVPLLTGLPIDATIVAAGIGTLFYIFTTKKKSPVFLSSSFAYISPMVSALALGGAVEKNFLAVIIGMAIVGLVYVIIALIIKGVGTAWLDKLLPPIVIGPVIMVIGLSLAGSAINNLTNTAVSADNYNIIHIVCGLVAMFVTAIAAIYGKNTIKLIPFVMGILAGYAVAAIFTVIGSY